jgi:hypothetical protein
MARAAKALSSPLHLLHRASQRADGLFARHVPDSDLTPRQFTVLQAVADKSGLSQTDIMAATGIDRSSTADERGEMPASCDPSCVHRDFRKDLSAMPQRPRPINPGSAPCRL